jgi:hypothetical protein
VIVPGSAAARAASVPVANGLMPHYIHADPCFAYDAAVTDLAATTDVATARWAARAMELPSDQITFAGPRRAVHLPPDPAHPRTPEVGQHLRRSGSAPVHNLTCFASWSRSMHPGV